MTSLGNESVRRVERPVDILQFGSGNFLRAFVDWMVQQTNEAGLTNHGIAVVYATHRPGRVDPLAAQDGLYHVVLEGVKDGRQVRRIDLVDAIQDVIDPWEDHERYQQVALSPQLKLVVSNTTEAGITWREDALAQTPASSFPGQVAQLLHDRFEAFDGSPDAGLDILACELIEDNGRTLKDLVRRHAEQAGWGGDFLDWLDAANRFHDTLVDRIVSGFPRDEAEAIQSEIGMSDAAIVKGELFSLWVIGGDNEALRALLPLDQLDLGVHFVPADAVGPFRSKKVRVLNGAHTALSAVGLSSGLATVDEAFADRVIHDYVTSMVDDEVLPTIDEPRAELQAFAAGILERFGNPALHHQLADIALNASAKWRTRNWPVVVDRWNAGLPAGRSVLALAVLLRLYAGRTDAGPFHARDEAAVLDAVQADGFGRPEWVWGVLDAMQLTGQPQSEKLRDQVCAALHQLEGEPLRTALRQPIPDHSQQEDQQ